MGDSLALVSGVVLGGFFVRHSALTFLFVDKCFIVFPVIFQIIKPTACTFIIILNTDMRTDSYSNRNMGFLRYKRHEHKHKYERVERCV